MTQKAETAGDSSISSSLLAQLQACEPEAWRRLTYLYSPLVYQWARRAGLQACDAADVMQDVFRAVHRGIGGFRNDVAGRAFRGWMWTITSNKLLDYHRAKAGRPQAAGGTTAQQQIAELAAREPPTVDAVVDTGGVVLRGLELVKSEFEDRTWQAFWRTAVDGLTAREVADELGMTANAVRLARSRVLRRLRTELDGLV